MTTLDSVDVRNSGYGCRCISLRLREACQARRRVAFYQAADLVDQLVLAQAGGVLPARLVDLSRLDLLIIDELGYLSLDTKRSDLFFKVVSKLYERGSVILTTNRAFEDWARIFAGDTTIAGAILDRLLHHRHVTAINGPSYRNPDITGPLPLHDDRDEV